MTADERRSLVQDIQTAAQKCRSNLIESFGDDPVFRDLNPTFFRDDELNLVLVCERVLRNGRVVEPIDLFNVLYLAHKSDAEPLLDIWFALAEKDPLPPPLDALR